MESPEKALSSQVTQHDENPVDNLNPKELQEDLRASRLNGWIPTTPEEKAANRALNRKLDIMLMGFCALIYIFQGLDRSNLGSAETGGLTADLGLPTDAINTAATLFFATYIPLAPFSTVIGKRVGQPLWLGIIGFLWGITTLATAWVKTEQQLYALRLLLGIFETGLYPTVMAYLTIFYPRYDVAFRVALFYSCYAIATAFGGLIAYGTFKIGGSLHPWQWLFIIEGSATIAISLATPFWLPKEPGSAWFLSESQRAFAVQRMKIDSVANVDDVHKITMRDIKAALCDWKLWMLLAPNICQGVTPLGLTIFFPIVVKVSKRKKKKKKSLPSRCVNLQNTDTVLLQALGYSGPNANLLTIPPYVLGCVVALIVCFLSDKYRRRVYGLLFAMSLSIIGLIMTITLPLENSAARYGGLLILIAGSFIGSPLQIAWLAGNTPEPGQRTVALGINGWGAVAGLIGSELVLPKYAPAYRQPLGIVLGLAVLAFLLFGLNAVVCTWINRKRAVVVANMTPEEIEDENNSDRHYGDKKITFVYGY